MTGLDIGRYVRRSRDQRVVEVRHRGIRCLVRILANRKKLLINDASRILRLDLRHFTRRRLRHVRLRLRLRRQHLLKPSFNTRFP